MSAPKQKWFFLRGLVRESGHWQDFLSRFEKEFPGREAVALDIPGNGQRFRHATPLSIAGITESMREEFLPLRGEENHLFALSLGAMVGLEWLRRWPEDFRSAVLVNTSLRGLSPFHHRLRPQNYGLILRMMLAGDPVFNERSILEITSHRREAFPAIVEEWVKIQEARPVSRRNALRQFVAAARFRPSQEKPRVPILLLGSAGDQLVDPRCSRAIAEHWHLPLKMHPTAGHDLTLDDPDWVIQQLRDYVDK